MKQTPRKIPGVRVVFDPKAREYLAVVQTFGGQRILGTGRTRRAARREAVSYLRKETVIQ